MPNNNIKFGLYCKQERKSVTLVEHTCIHVNKAGRVGIENILILVVIIILRKINIFLLSLKSVMGKLQATNSKISLIK